MKKLTLLKSLLLGGMLFTATSLFSQVNISAGSTVTQNFDGLGTSATATLPTGWKVDKNTTVRTVGTYSAAGTATELIAGNSMSSSAQNGIYNFGAGVAASATDRAIGGISSTSASKSVNVYVQLTNNGTTSINNFTIGFDVEKYRNGTNSAGFTIQMYYSTDGSTWTSAGDDFKVSFAGSDADNNGYTSAPGATTSISGKTLSQSLAAGSSLYLAWNYSVTSGSTTSSAQALGIDNVSITANTGEAPATPTITVTEVTIPAFSATAGSSQDQTITVNGTNLTGNIMLALSGTDADKAMFELSEYVITPTSGTVTDKVITITYTPTAPGSHAVTLTLSSQDATNVTRDLTGTASLAQPTVNTPTNITNTGLTLNWNEVTGATEYEVNVYTKTTGTVTATDLFISEYGEGSGGNKKYVEIFNGTGNDVDLSNYVIKRADNGNGWNTTGYSFPASTVLANGSTFVLANNSTDVIGATAYSTFCTWNGNDAIGLFKNDVLIDVFGTPTSDPGTGWSIAGIADASVDHILIRKPTVTSPTTDWAISAGTTAEDSQWIVSDFLYNATNQTTDLGSHTMDGFGTINTPITGSPFTVSATSLQITGLTAATTYYYTVTAKNGSYVSPASDEASASTLGTATSNVAVRGIFVRNGQVVVTAPAAGERIEIFNAVGQRLVSKLATAGENAIPVSAKGVLVVKFGSEVTKVIVP